MNQVPEIIKVDAKSKRCDCQIRCTEFFRVNGIDVYCKSKLEDLAFDILKLVNGIDLPQRQYAQWSVKQEVAIIKYINEYGVQNGTFSKLAVILNKTRVQVKRKVYQLEKDGRLQYEKYDAHKKAGLKGNQKYLLKKQTI